MTVALAFTSCLAHEREPRNEQGVAPRDEPRDDEVPWGAVGAEHAVRAAYARGAICAMLVRGGRHGAIGETSWKSEGG